MAPHRTAHAGRLRRAASSPLIPALRLGPSGGKTRPMSRRAEESNPDVTSLGTPALLGWLPRPAAHWTPRYLVARARVLLHERFVPDEPWLTADMIHFLSDWIRPTDVVVEFGSGRSTTWFARRAGEVISVEHEADWYAAVRNRIQELRLDNVHYFHSESDPVRYPRAGESVLRSKADLILVDGQHRDHCAIWALAHIKPGGLIVVDNVNWFLPHPTRSPSSVGPAGSPKSAEWAAFAEATSAWRRYWTTNDVTDTAAFFAPIQV